MENSQNKSLDLLNNYLSKNIFEVSIFPDNNQWELKSKVKLKVTGIQKYFRIGVKMNHIQYTITILPSDNKNTNNYNSLYAEIYGTDVKVTTSSREYREFRLACNSELVNILKYFGINLPVICTRVINKAKEKIVTESLIREGKLDNVVRQVVRDIITILKKGKDGEFGLPEDLYEDELEYEFSQLNSSFSVFLEISTNDSVEGFEVDASYYNDDNLISLEIITNPSYGEDIIQPLIGELNEVIRHELEHLKQYESGYKFPKNEPKNPEKYYTQSHELDAQRAGFKRRSKGENISYESLVRRWFDENRHKHKMSDEQAERVIQKLLKLK